jgi:arginine deiminase
MRDPGFVLGETLFLSRMFWKIRRREPYILRELIEHHPFLKYVKTNTLDMDEGLQEAVSIEGGDTMAIAPGHYAIAESERTSRALIRKVAEYLFTNKKAEKLYQPLIPPKRAYIHLDTVCSLVGPSAVIVHTEAFNAYSETLLWTPEVIRRRGEPISLGINFIDVLQYEFRKEVIQAAGGGSRARLEQFDDATNVFMVNPETPMCYDRNTHTNQILRDKGFNVGVFSGSDLVMGRGGARCMTLPLHRD